MRIHLLATTAAVALLAATSAHAQNATWLSILARGISTPPPTGRPAGSADRHRVLWAVEHYKPDVLGPGQPSADLRSMPARQLICSALPGPTTPLTFNGAGIINNSSNAPSFSLTRLPIEFYEQQHRGQRDHHYSRCQPIELRRNKFGRYRHHHKQWRSCYFRRL